jgi:heme/copper-type cytochrome/quinol oxidase subunit 2
MISLVAALAIGLTTADYYPTLNTVANPTPVTQTSSCVKPPDFFLIVADLNGYNDSVAHLQKAPNAPWPVIRVNRGDKVNILVCNLDHYSPHGFAIQHYFEQGTALMPHQTFRISFVADQDGTFIIFCTIFCPIHPYMISGQLIVTS